MTDHTQESQIIPWNHTLESQIMTPNDRSYPAMADQMTDHTLEAQVIPWKHTSFPGITDPPPK